LDLFGKRKCEERIEDLLQQLSSQQKEKEELLKTIEKRDEKIRRLTSAYQESCVDLKAALQKASQSQLQSQSQAASELPKPESPMEISAQRVRLGPHDIERLMKRLLACRSPYDDSFTGYVQNADDLPKDILKQIKSLRSRRGLIVFHSPQLFTLALVPPFPVNEKLIEAGSAFRLDPLKEMMETPVIVASVHAGDTFLGMALSSEDFEEKENIESQVKEKHSKGGWSQKRFERLREEDIKAHVDAVAQRLSDLSKRYGSVAKFAVLTGDPVLLKQIAPAAGIQVLERRLERHDESHPKKLLEEVYGFMCYRF
jgi:predicted RNase H-like nuclease (RuvC/YqgF family)